MKPPNHVAPHVLFQRMLELPRPSKAIEFRIRGVEHIPLVIRSVTWHDEVAAAASKAAMLVYIQRSLWTPEGRAFRSIEEVGMLAESEVDSLGGVVAGALLEVSPSYSRNDWQAWHEQLKVGAADWRNITAAMALADCADEGYSTVRPHPERYWGVTPPELTDGQRMAAHAAMAVMGRMREEHRAEHQPATRQRPGRR